MPSSGNIFADLGLPDSDTLKLKSSLVIEIALAKRDLGLSPQVAAERMGLTLAQAMSLSRLFDSYTVDELRTYLARLKG